MSASQLIPLFLVGCLTCMAVAWLLVFTRGWHGRFSMDSDLQGVQKMHSTPVPRVGGVAIALGLAACAWWLQGLSSSHVLAALCLSSLPVLLAGLLEDLTKRVRSRTRLLAAFGSAALAWLFYRWHLPRVDTPGLDWLMGWLPFALAFTCFAVGGITNAVNIIDGFNGFSTSVLLLLFAGLGYLAVEVSDVRVQVICLTGFALSLGFLCVNYPQGRLFLGDGGAYLLGFVLAMAAVILIQANPTVRVWQVLAVCAYPFIEVVFSMYRRRLIHRVAADAPDRLHLHSLVYRRLSRPHWGKDASRPWRANAMVTPLLLPLVALTVLLGLVLGRSTTGAWVAMALNVAIYGWAYRTLVRFRGQRLLWWLARRP